MIGLAVSFLIATSPVPVMDVLQVYGRLAGPECFGKTVPPSAGASCQLTAERIRETIGDVNEASFEARAMFTRYVKRQPAEDGPSYRQPPTPGSGLSLTPAEMPPAS